MAIGIVDTVRNAMLNAIRDAIDAGPSAGKIRIYSGTRPATGGAATTLLAELTMSDPCAPAASGGVLTLSAITEDSSADNTGTATWFRVLDSNNNTVFDGSVGTSGADLNLITTSIVAGQPVQITAFTITAGN